MTGIEKITEKIISDARARAAEIIESAETQARGIKRSYEDRAEKVCEQLDSEAEAEADSVINRAKASVETIQRNALLAEQAEIIDGVFAEAYNSIRTLPDDKYVTFLATLAASALYEQVESYSERIRLYGADEDEKEIEAYEILLSNSDRDKYASDLIGELRRTVIGKVPPEVIEKVTISKQAANIDGGLILRYGDIESNCSLSLMLDRVRAELQGQVSKTLFSRVEQ